MRKQIKIRKQITRACAQPEPDVRATLLAVRAKLRKALALSRRRRFRG
jgi:hypothetical protein